MKGRVRTWHLGRLGKTSQPHRPSARTTAQCTGLGQWGQPNWSFVIFQTKYSVPIFFSFSNDFHSCADSGLVTPLCWIDLQTLSGTVINFLQGNFLLCLCHSYSPNRLILPPPKIIFPNSHACFGRRRALNTFKSYRMFFAWQFLHYWALVLIQTFTTRNNI